MSDRTVSDAAIAAMAHPSRRRIVDAVAAAPDGATIFDLAGVVGLHHNAVRSHMAALARAGVVWSERERGTGRPGRPRIVYRLAHPEMVAEVNPRHELVGLLLKLVKRAHITETEVEAVGVEDGRRMAAEGIGFVESFRRMGFAPDDVTDGTAAARGEVTVMLRHCPFADAADGEHGATVCALHRGVARGILATVGGEILEFTPADPRAGECRVVARVPADPAD